MIPFAKDLLKICSVIIEKNKDPFRNGRDRQGSEKRNETTEPGTRKAGRWRKKKLLLKILSAT